MFLIDALKFSVIKIIEKYYVHCHKISQEHFCNDLAMFWKMLDILFPQLMCWLSKSMKQNNILSNRVIMYYFVV